MVWTLECVYLCIVAKCSNGSSSLSSEWTTLLDAQHWGLIIDRPNVHPGVYGSNWGDLGQPSPSDYKESSRPLHLQSTTTVHSKNCSYIYICTSLCTVVVHNAAQNRSNNLPSYPTDSHYCSDVVYWRSWKEVGVTVEDSYMHFASCGVQMRWKMGRHLPRWGGVGQRQLPALVLW